MAIATVVAGAFTGTYNSVALNYTQNGFEINLDTHGELINETDLWGESITDIVYRGASCRVIAECRVQSGTAGQGNLLAFFPWGTLGQISAAASPVGRLGSAVAQSLVLSSVANTPAAAAIIATFTASKSILSPGSNLRLLLNSRSRNVPLNLMCLPVESGGTTSFFTYT